jgi:serine protease Do
VIQRGWRAAAAAAVLMLVAGCNDGQREEAARPGPLPQAAEGQIVVGWAPLIREVLPAVVSVSTRQQVARPQPFPPSPHGDSPFDRFLREFFGYDFPLPRRQLPPEIVQGIGSGFIIDPAGFIVTNHHVVEGAQAIEVGLIDGRRFPAELVGSDPHTDIALLRIRARERLPHVELGDSDAMFVGDPIAAVGNPFGLGGTVTSGIVSAMGRDLGLGPHDDFLQIDAAINRGNSGGPTFNLEGKVIGVNSAIFSPTGAHVGIGFAIPSNVARQVVERLRARG